MVGDDMNEKFGSNLYREIYSEVVDIITRSFQNKTEKSIWSLLHVTYIMQ